MAVQGGSNKAATWLHIMYPENMIEGWEEKLPDILGIPFAWCRHNADYSIDGEERKDHVHGISHWSEVTGGTQTKKRAWETIEQLAIPGRTCSKEPRFAGSIEHAYKYLIHDTEAAQKAGKHLYDKSERHTCNGFDIDRYIVLDADAKNEMLKMICDDVNKYRFRNFSDAYDYVSNMHTERYTKEMFWEVLKGNSAIVDRIVKGNYHRTEYKAHLLTDAKCFACGCPEVIGNVQKDNELYWFCKQHQETMYIVLQGVEEHLEAIEDCKKHGDKEHDGSDLPWSDELVKEENEPEDLRKWRKINKL